jgi:hypothetical protein
MMPPNLAPTRSASTTTTDDNRSARPYTRGTMTRLSNSWYPIIAARTMRVTASLATKRREQRALSPGGLR